MEREYYCFTINYGHAKPLATEYHRTEMVLRYSEHKWQRPRGPENRTHTFLPRVVILRSGQNTDKW